MDSPDAPETPDASGAPGSPPDARIAALISEYFDRKQAGEDITAESFAREHPNLADELKPFLEGLSLLSGMSEAAGGVKARFETATEDLALPTIAGYVLQDEIGHGGMGMVYKALQISTKRIVALKVVLAGSFASPSVRHRFKREVELAARLQHPNIIRVLESGRVERQRYYAMDYVDGVPLDNHLTRGQSDRTETLKIFMQICDAVDYAHLHGVVHRDLKPANILVDEEGTPHILDFGLAKAMDQTAADQTFITEASDPGQILGTLPYLSPEQAEGATTEVDARTDIYAIGVMLYQTLTGSMPYDVTGHPTEVLSRIREEAPALPSSFPIRADGELDAIVLKALEKERDRRYQTARELGDDLHRYIQGEPLLARPPSGLYAFRKRVRKHRFAAATALASIIFAVIAAIVVLADLQDRREALADARRKALVLQHSVEEGSPEQAAGNARVLLSDFPQLPEARLLCAHALWGIGQQEQAISLLESSLRSEPSRWACRVLLSEICRTTGDVGRADTLLAQAEIEAHDSSEAWYLRSFATFDIQRARRCAEHAVELDSSNAANWIRVTYLRTETGDPDGAIQGCRRLIELGESPYEWLALQGRILVEHGRYRQAIDELTKLIEPEARDALRWRAIAYRRLNDYENALADYTLLLESAPESSHVVWDYYQRATPLWILGRSDEAIADYEQVRVLLGRPHYSDARRYLILREQGRLAEARQVLAAALSDVQDHWLRQVFRCLAGEITPEELIADGIARDNLEQLCEAYYYAGEVCLMADRPLQARGFFNQCVKTGIEYDPDTALATPMNEFELAHWRLRTIPD